MRAQGLRPVRLWAPDTGAAGFADEYSRQCRLVNEAGAADPDLHAWDAFIEDGNRGLDEDLSRLERAP